MLDQNAYEWLQLAEMYSQCELTMKDDKLAAITGMARKIHHITRLKYCPVVSGATVSVTACSGYLVFRKC